MLSNADCGTPLTKGLTERHSGKRMPASALPAETLTIPVSAHSFAPFRSSQSLYCRKISRRRSSGFAALMCREEVKKVFGDDRADRMQGFVSRKSFFHEPAHRLDHRLQLQRNLVSTITWSVACAVTFGSLLRAAR